MILKRIYKIDDICEISRIGLMFIMEKKLKVWFFNSKKTIKIINKETDLSFPIKEKGISSNKDQIILILEACTESELLKFIDYGDIGLNKKDKLYLEVDFFDQAEIEQILKIEKDECNENTTKKTSF